MSFEEGKEWRQKNRRENDLKGRREWMLKMTRYREDNCKNKNKNENRKQKKKNAGHELWRQKRKWGKNEKTIQKAIVFILISDKKYCPNSMDLLD